MKQIKVLGTGCAKCRATVQRIEDVAKAMNIAITLEKVERIEDIVAFGVMSTPGVVVDGEVVHFGSVPDRRKVESWF